VDLFPRMGDVQVAFAILTCCFMQRPSYLLWCTPPSSIFIKPFISFDSPFHKMFRHLLGPRSFDSHEGPLTHKQTSFLITFGGFGLISTSTITPTTYLRNWAFVALIIATRFMVDQHPFLLEAFHESIINFLSSNTLKTTCDLLPPLARACFRPFEQLIRQQIVQFQDSISERLHHHNLFNMLFDKTFKAHCHNPNIGFTIKCEVQGPMKPKVCLRVKHTFTNGGECKGWSLMTPKCTLTLGIALMRELQMFIALVKKEKEHQIGPSWHH
jgi:hypothetical protein